MTATGTRAELALADVNSLCQLTLLTDFGPMNPLLEGVQRPSPWHFTTGWWRCDQRR